MKEKGQVIAVNCKRCGVKMMKWKRSVEEEAEHPFPLIEFTAGASHKKKFGNLTHCPEGLI
jgi:hypothetical protein